MQWVTRRQIRVNRAATAWLIRRFIDPEAVFVFVEPNEVADVQRRTEIARTVHSADFKEGLAAVPEAAGLLAISQGFPLVARDDLETVERTSFLYDALYAFLQSTPQGGDN